MLHHITERGSPFHEVRQLAWAGHGSDHGQRLGGEAEVVPEAELAEAVERPGHRHGHHQGQDLRGHSEWGWALGRLAALLTRSLLMLVLVLDTLLSTHCCAEL